MSFFKRTFTHSENEKIFNEKGEYIGEIAEIRYNKDPDEAEYIILRRENLAGEDQYFAIPTCPGLFHLNEEGNIICGIDETGLQIAVEIEAKDCPKRNPAFSQTIFELNGYV